MRGMQPKISIRSLLVQMVRSACVVIERDAKSRLNRR